MNVVETNLPDVMLLTPQIFPDKRGFFFESYNAEKFRSLTGCSPTFVQDNHSRSSQFVLRGLHYQVTVPQAKLVRVIVGEIYDVAVDLRRHSPHFGSWTGNRISAQNRQQVWIPEGFAHGFLVLSEYAEILYKTTTFWTSNYDRCLIWNDPDIGIAWPVHGKPILSDRDERGLRLSEAELFD